MDDPNTQTSADLPGPTESSTPSLPQEEVISEQEDDTVVTGEVVPEISADPNNPASAQSSDVAKPNVTIERTPDTVTITEIMTPKVEPEPEVSRPGLDTSTQSKSFLASLLPKLKEKLAGRTEKRLAKILALAREKSAKGESIQNDDVEKLLHVSDRTASRYLKQLVEKGHLKDVGAIKHAKYTRT